MCIIQVMKESFAYENRTGEIKKSLSVGTNCVGVIAGRIWEANKEIIAYRLRDGIQVRQRTAHLKELLERV